VAQGQGRVSTVPLRFPVAHEYSTAVQNPDKMFRSDVLKQARFLLDGPGRPKVYSGNFASTFVAQRADGRKVAVRVFLKADPHNRDERYRKISAFLAVHRPPSFATFEYLADEVLSQGRRWPVIVMEWVEGQTLDVFMSQAAARGRRDLLTALRASVLKLSEEVERGKFAHGDLNTGNLLVSPELRHGIKLVDFDGMYVPGMATGSAGAPGEEGTPGTRHPLRRRAHFGPEIDRFSCIVIDVCAATLLEAPDAWNSFNTDPSRLLFDETDFQQPSASKAFKHLEARASPELRRLLQQLIRIAADPPEKCPTLTEFQRLAGSINQSAQSAAIATMTLASPLASSLATQVRQLERRVLDGRRFEELRTNCDSEVDVVAPVFEEPQEKLDRNGDRYLFLNFGNWRLRSSVKVIVWGGEAIDEFFEHARDVGRVRKGSFAQRWVCVTGTPQYYAPHNSVDIPLNSVGQLRFITEDIARDMLERSRLGQYRGGVAVALIPEVPARGAVTPVAANPSADVQSLNARVLAGRGVRTSPVAAVQPTAAAPASAPPVWTSTPTNSTQVGLSVAAPRPMSPQQGTFNGNRWRSRVFPFIGVMLFTCGFIAMLRSCGGKG
jgi:hypothetical protein